MTPHRSLFAPPRRPYYIDAPAYRRTSAGIRVMHLLCHALNCAGEEAYLYPTLTNPLLNTPLLTPETMLAHDRSGRKPITVYPEVVSGNPRQSSSVVRYVLNKAGLLGGNTAFPPEELVFAYGRNVLPSGVDPSHILFLPPIDTQVFNNLNNPHDTDRKGILFYPGRYQLAASEHPDLFRDATVITSSWPESPVELATLFRRSELVYCFESTAIALEATLCGCAAVILPSPLFDGALLSENEIGRHGIAVGNDSNELALARQTVGQMWEDYCAAEERFWQQLGQFIACSQAMPIHPVGTIDAMSLAQTRIATQFLEWKEKRSPQEIDVQLLAERMVQAWTHRPQFHLLLELREGESGLLADTLDSLSAQLYEEWLLTIITTDAKPEGLDEIARLQWLSLKDEAHVAYVVNEMAAHSPCHWLARIAPGVTFEPHALLVVADKINLSPRWMAVYTDEDTREPDGTFAQPCFKPGPDIFMLRQQSYPGSFVAVRKDAFLAAGQYGNQPDAEVYDLTLRVADACDLTALGHISDVLVHLPRQTSRCTNTAAEQSCVEAHLARQRLVGKVVEGEVFGTRRVIPQTPEWPAVSILIESNGATATALQTAEAILGSTDYPAVEVLLAEHASNSLHQDLMRAGVKSLRNGRIRVVDAPIEASRSERISHALGMTSGSHVLLLEAGTRPVHPAWLHELALAASWPGIGAVQAGLRTAASAELVCPPYSPAMLFSPVGLAKATIHTLPTQQRTLAAIDPRGVLVSKNVLSTFTSSTPALPPTYWGLALARFIVANELQMLWKPEVQLNLPADDEAPRRVGVYAGPHTVERMPQADFAFLSEHIDWLANGHLYNGQLSYSQPCQFNLNRMTEWDIDQGDRPKLLALGSEQARLPAESHRNLEKLTEHALAQVSFWTLEKDADPWMTMLEVARIKPDTVVFGHRTMTEHAPLIALLRQWLPEIRRIYCLDDGAQIKPGTHATDLQLVELMCAAISPCEASDRVVATSTALVDVLRPYADDVRLALPWLDWTEDLTGKPERDDQAIPKIGLIHPEHDKTISNLLLELVTHFKGRAQFVCIGDAPGELNACGVISIKSADASLVTHTHLVQTDLKLVLLPCLPMLRSQLQNDRLVLNAMAAGIPCLSSPSATFNPSPLIQPPLEAAAWIEALEALLSTASTRTDYGHALARWGQAHFGNTEGQQAAVSAYLN